MDQYICSLKAEELPIQESEILSLEQLRMEALFLGLRTKKGIDVEDFGKKFQYDLMLESGKLLKRLQDEGFLSIEAGHLHPTLSGLALADSLALI